VRDWFTVTVPEVPPPDIPVPAVTPVIVPLPEGVFQVPSPNQAVVEEADVPELRLVTGRLPVTPVVNGRPVALVSTPEAGVPRVGVTRVGLLDNTLLPVPVLTTETKFLLLSVATASEAVNPERLRLVPVAAPMTGVVIVLLVRVCVPVRVTI
jgi:hypothetical protein